MQNAVLVRVVHSARDFCNEFCCLPDGYRTATDRFVETISFDETHTEVVRAVAFTDFVDRNDPRMIELCGGFCFPAEALQVRVGCPLANANDLYRDRAIETLLPGAKYYALTTPADFLQQFVVAKLFGHLRWRRSSFTMRFGIRIHAALSKERPNLKPASPWRPIQRLKRRRASPVVSQAQDAQLE